jgi:methyl-accepting chemotaxis protein
MFTWFNNLRVQTKLILAFLLIVLLNGAAIGWGLYSIREMDTETGHIAQETNELIELEEIQTNLLKQEAGELRFLLTGESSYIEHHEELERVTSEQIEVALALEQHDTGREMLRTLQDEHEQYSAAFDKVIALHNKGSKAEAITMSLEQSSMEIEHAQEQIAAVVEESIGDVRIQAEQTTQYAQTAFGASLVTLVVSVVAGLGIGIALARSISNPLSVVVRGANLLAAGDAQLTSLDQSEVKAVAARQDEMGDIGRAFAALIAYLQEMADAARRLAQGDVAAAVKPRSERDVLGNAFRQMIAYQQQVAEAAEQLAQGDVTVNVEPQSERDALGVAFDQMIINLRTLIGQTMRSASQVADASEQLRVAVDQSNEAVQQVVTSVQQVAKGTAQQAQSVAEATTNVESIARAADGIARGAQEQAQGVQSTANLINDVSNIIGRVEQITGEVTVGNSKVTQAAYQGVSAVEQTGQGMETIRARSTAAATKVKEMGSRSKEIGRIVETIDDIADKTDMLALNAAVEAARAGEHGRGFAVVAEQVRKLSEDSKEATRDIGLLIERVQETVREAIAAMEQTVIEVDNGSRLTKETAKALQEILQAAEAAGHRADQISGAVAELKHKNEGVVSASEAVNAVVEENTAVAEEMAAGSQEIIGTMENIASVAQENSAATEEVNALSEEMSAQVEEMVASAEQLSALAEELRTAAANFKIDEEEREQPKRRPKSVKSDQRPMSRVGTLRPLREKQRA